MAQKSLEGSSCYRIFLGDLDSVREQLLDRPEFWSLIDDLDVGDQMSWIMRLYLWGGGVSWHIGHAYAIVFSDYWNYVKTGESVYPLFLI